MIGIRFKIPNDWDRYLYKIISDIDTSNMKWYLADEEVHLYNNEFLFDDEYYDDSSFRAIIKKENYYIIFANIQAYNIKDSFDKIKTYEDFRNSSCQLAIIIVDCEFVDVYAKDVEILKTIQATAVKNKFQNIQELYEPDSMTNFQI